MRVSPLLTLALASLAFTFGCEGCLDDTNLNFNPDPDPEEEEPPPPPPVFPLKAGDVLSLRPIGGRTDEDQGGSSDLAISANWQIKSVALNSDNRWEVTADVLYEVQSDAIAATAISRLVLENVADFPELEDSNFLSAEGAKFDTTKAPNLDPTKYRPNHFPFFQPLVEGNDEDDGAVFNAAAAEFRAAFTALDPEAKIETQIAAGKLEAIFRDDQNGPVSLHKVRAEIHPFGFVCGWDEALIPFTEGMQRAQAPFTAFGTPPLAAILFGIPTLTRDGNQYTCGCFDRTCRRGNGADRVCLDPTDPDAAPGPCP